MLRKPWFIALAMGLAVLLLAAAAAVRAPATGPGPGPAHGLPWQVEVLPGGAARVFSIQVPGSTLAQLQQRFGEDLKLALVQRRGRADALEAFVERFDAQGVGGRLVIEFDLDPVIAATWRQRSPRHERASADTLRHALSSEDLAEAQSRSVASLTFVPVSKLDEAVLLQRFGEPFERQSLAAGGARWLYPERGLALARDAAGRTVLWFVPPADFARRVAAEPLPTEP